MLSAIGSGQPTPLQADAGIACGGSAGLSTQERLLFLSVFAEMSRSDAAESSIEVSSERLSQLRDEARRALAAAREAQEDSGLWGKLSSVLNGDIGSLAQMVAMAAAAVASGGAAIVLAAIAIGATLASKYADELGIPPNVAIGLGVAAGLCSAASGNFAAGTTALTGYRATAHTIQVGAQMTGAAASGAGAVAGGVSGYYAAEAIECRANLRNFESAQTLESAEIDSSLAQLERAIGDRAFAVETTTKMVQNDHRSAQFVLNNFAGAA